jgi:integrase
VKAWIITKRIEGKVRTLRIGECPELPTIHAAVTKAAEMVTPVAIKSSAKRSGLSTLHDALEQVLANSTASQKTIDLYGAQTRRHLSALFATPVANITFDDLENALRPHLRMIDGKQCASRTYYTSLKQIIVMAFKRAETARRIPNVANDLGAPKTAPKRNNVQIDTRDTWPILAMIETKRNAPRSYETALAWELMLFTSLRSINVRELKWSDVDLERATLRVPELKNGLDVTFPLA